MDVEIKIIGEIDQVETICVASSIREIDRIRKLYGPGRWRKLKGNARVRLPDVLFAGLGFIGTKLMVLARKRSRLNVF